MNPGKDLLLYLYWVPFRKVARRLPPAILYWISSVLGGFLFLVARNKRQRLEREWIRLFSDNCAPEISPTIIKKSFNILMGNQLEILCYDCLSAENISQYIDCEGLHHLDQARKRGNGAILLFAHFGANQMVMPAIGYRGYSMSQLSAPATVWTEVMPDRTFSAMEKKAMHIRWQLESALPVEHINIFGSLKKAYLCLKKNQVLGLAVDGGWGKDRIALPFLGRKILVSTGAAHLAARLGCPLLPTFVVREACGRNKMIIEGPLPAVTDTRQESITAALARFVSILEDYVIKYPDHYLNFIELRQRMAERGDTPLLEEVEE